MTLVRALAALAALVSGALAMAGCASSAERGTAGSGAASAERGTAGSGAASAERGTAGSGASSAERGTAGSGAASAALRTAAAAGDVTEVDRLVRAGAPVDEADASGRTALLEAVEGDHVETVRALLAAGADVNAQAANRDTPWLQAGALGRTEILRLLLPAGPDLSIRNRFGGNALIPACERAHVDTVRFLLAESGIDVDHVNDLGWTCLLEAVILGDGGPDHQEVVRLVLAAGADPDLPDREGVTPLVHARRAGQDAVVALLVAAGATG